VTKAGEASTNSSPASLNLTSIYTFSEGFLRGFRAGGTAFVSWTNRRYYYYPNGVTVTGDREIDLAGHSPHEQSPELVIASAVGLRGSAAHRSGDRVAAEDQFRGFARAAERTCEHFADRDAERADGGSDRARVGAPRIGEIALIGAVLEARHALVVLAEVRRRMAEVEDVTPLAQRIGEAHARRRLCCWRGTLGSLSERTERCCNEQNEERPRQRVDGSPGHRGRFSRRKPAECR